MLQNLFTHLLDSNYLANPCHVDFKLDLRFIYESRGRERDGPIQLDPWLDGIY